MDSTVPINIGCLQRVSKSLDDITFISVVSVIPGGSVTPIIEYKKINWNIT